MAHYQIISSAGMDMGTWEAESARAAIEAMHVEAGVETTDALVAELTVREVADVSALVRAATAVLGERSVGSTGDLRTVCEQAIRDGEGTVEDVVRIWREAETDAAAEVGS